MPPMTMNPPEGLREALAKIIDPYAFRPNVEYDLLDKGYQAKALTKADAIMALSPPLVGSGGGGRRLCA